MIHADHDDTVVGDLVEVTWVDAAFDLDSPVPPILMHSLGWIVERTDGWITIASPTPGARGSGHSFN